MADIATDVRTRIRKHLWQQRFRCTIELDARGVGPAIPESALAS